MTFEVAVKCPPLRVEPDGTVRVGQTRVTLDTVVGAYQMGATIEQIVLQYPSLALADAYETIAYYLHHKEQVDSYLRDRLTTAAAIRNQIESDPATQQLRQRLLGRRDLARE